MPPKRKFRPPKTEEEEKKDLEDFIPKATRDATKWAFKVFSEWQISRNNKDPSQEQCSYKVGLAKIQSINLNAKERDYIDYKTFEQATGTMILLLYVGSVVI